jgi:PAS domain S-box-containing protein
VLTAALAGWALVNLVEKSLVHHDLRRAVSIFLYVFIVTVPGAWLVFAALFARQDRRLPRRLVPLLFLEPMLILALAFTNPYHGLIYAATEMKMDGPHAVMAITHGPFFFVHAAYSYLLFAAGAALLVARVACQPDRSAGRLAILIGAMLVPLLGNVAYVVGWQPRRLTDLTPVYFAVPGLAAAWLLFRFRVFDVLPIARDFVLDCLSDAVFVLDTRFRILDLNRAARALVPGLRQGRKRPLSDALPELGQYLPTQPGAGGSASGIRLGSACAGRYWDMHVLPLIDLGATIGVLVRLTDVTERRRSTEALARLAAIVEFSEDAIIGMTLDGVVVSWNPGAERLYGYSGGEVRGSRFSILFPPGHADEMPELLENLRRGKRTESSEFVHVRKDGGRVNVALRFSPIKDTTGAVTGVSAIGRDVTERRRLEEELRRQAQLLAVADRHKDEFLAMLGHELRNPLAPLLNAVQLLRRLGPPDPHVQRPTDLIERQAKAMTRLVDDLLDVSRITSKKINLQREQVDLAAVVAIAVETARPLIDARGQVLTVTPPPDAVRLEADPTRLAQVIGNLLNNAAKYTEEGGHIWLTAGREGNEAAVRIRDDGLGIPAGLLPEVFDLFTQGDRTLARSGGGLGIGLTLVKRLVELHGGSVEARSAGAHQGSEFIVRLPTGGVRPAPTSNHSAGRPPPSPRSTARRVLVVDDNVDAVESLAMLLRVEGHEVRTAHDGPSALSAAETFRPEVVLLDIGLPGMDGYEVARRLRQEPGLEKVLLVAVTGYGQEEDRRLSREAAIDHHLVKPVDPEALLALLAHPESLACRAAL